MINSIAENSPAGRKILETAAKEGYALCFENPGLSHGICNSRQKRIALNPRVNDAKLTATLTHEARHAGQIARLPEQFLKYDIATELRLHRAKEADAQAAALQTALEIRAATGNGKTVEELRKTNPELFAEPSHSDDEKASPQTVAADSGKNMAVAFCGWFESNLNADLYERDYLRRHLDLVNNASDRYKKGFFRDWTMDRHMSSAEIVKNICADENGGSYIADPDIMNRPKMSRISSATKQAADKFFNDRERLTGKAADKSYAGMGKPSLQQTLMNMRPAANATNNRILQCLADSRSR